MPAKKSFCFNVMRRKYSRFCGIIEQLIADLKSPDADRLMTVKEVAEYTGFSTQWVTKYKEAIGYSQPPGGDIRFRKSKVDAYFAKHEILKKN